jgi:hypothetical protein
MEGKLTMRKKILTALRKGAKRIPMCLGFALVAPFLHLNATGQAVNLGTAANFAVLAGSTATSTGSTVINGGDVGVSTGNVPTGGTLLLLGGRLAALLAFGGRRERRRFRRLPLPKSSTKRYRSTEGGEGDAVGRGRITAEIHGALGKG